VGKEKELGGFKRKKTLEGGGRKQKKKKKNKGRGSLAPTTKKILDIGGRGRDGKMFLGEGDGPKTEFELQ